MDSTRLVRSGGESGVALPLNTSSILPPLPLRSALSSRTFHPPPINTTITATSSSSSSSSSTTTTGVINRKYSQSPQHSGPVLESPHLLFPPSTNTDTNSLNNSSGSSSHVSVLLPSSPLSAVPPAVLYCGMLKKKSPSSFSFDRRYFSLTTQFLSYFSKSTDHFPLGYLNLNEILSVSSSGNQIELGLMVTSDSKEKRYKLLAENKEECERWRKEIETAVIAVKREEAKSRSFSIDEPFSPKTPAALKRANVSEQLENWKEQPSELEKSFFTLKFSSKRGTTATKLLMDVRNNLDILRFLLELLLDAPELRSYRDQHKRQSIDNAKSAPFTVLNQVSVKQTNGANRSSILTNDSVQVSPAPSSIPPRHHRNGSAISNTHIREFNEKPTKDHKSTSNPCSPGGTSRQLTTPVLLSQPTGRPGRTNSVITSSAFQSKMKQINDKLASYTTIVRQLNYDDKQFLLSWVLSASTLNALTDLFALMNPILHDRLLRVLYLCAMAQMKREKKLTIIGVSEDGIEEFIGDRYAIMMKRQLDKIDQPAYQLQWFQSLLTMMITSLSSFPSPVFASLISFTSTNSYTVYHPALFRTLFASLFHTDFHLRKKVLKDLTHILNSPGQLTSFAQQREWQRWLFLLICDIPMRAKKKNGVIKKVNEYITKLLCEMHALTFCQREIDPNNTVALPVSPQTTVSAASSSSASSSSTTSSSSLSSQSTPSPLRKDTDELAADQRRRKSTTSTNSSKHPVAPLPGFAEIMNRSLLLSWICSPAHYAATTRSSLLYLTSHLLKHSELFIAPDYLSQVNTAGSPKLMDPICFLNLIHLCTLIKTFVFVPARFTEIISAAQSSLSASIGSRYRAPSPAQTAEVRGQYQQNRPGPSVLPFTASASFITDLISSIPLLSTLQQRDLSDPFILDLSLLLNSSLASLTTEHESPRPYYLHPPEVLDPNAALINGGLVSNQTVLNGYDVHRFEKRGMKADAELLGQMTRLLQTLCAQQWSSLTISPVTPSSSSAAKAGNAIKVNDRLQQELTFFQDAYMFLLLLSPMVSTEDIVNPSASTAVSTPFTTSLLTPSETGEIIQQFLSVKAPQRRKVFRHYEDRYRSRELAEHKAAEQRSKIIEQQMLIDAEKERNVNKILLLGVTEAGKSTLFKQVKRVYGSGFNVIDRQHHVIVIFANMLRAMRALLYHSERLLVRFPFSALSNATGASTTSIDPQHNDSKLFILSFDLLQHFPLLSINTAGKIIPQSVQASELSALCDQYFSELFVLAVNHLHLLWNDRGIQLTYENRSKFDLRQLYDSDGFFLDRLEEMTEQRQDWLPTEADVVRTRLRSLSVDQFNWTDPTNGLSYRMTDVAGQRSERKKWMPLFNDTTLVIYVAALSEYDQVLAEDPSINRLIDSLQTWQHVTAIQWLEPVPFILLLNKLDLYQQKIDNVSLRVCFPKYRGGSTAEEGLDYISNEFVKRVRTNIVSAAASGTGINQMNGEREIYVHVISAVDMEAANLTMDTVKEIVKKKHETAAINQQLQ